MKKIFYVIFLFVSGFCFSQINVEEIKKNIDENPQKYFYDYLEIFRKDSFTAFSGADGLNDFKQKTELLPDGSTLKKYSIGNEEIYVKLVGGF